MKTINFSDRELESMIEMYRAELEEAQMYISQIQELLKKLGAQPVKAEVLEKEPKVAKKRGRKAQTVKVAIEDKPKAKRGRKAKVLVPTPEPLVPVKPVEKVIKKKPKSEKNSVAKQATVPIAKITPVATKPKKEVVKHEPKPKKIAAKAKAEKKPVTKPAPKKKPEPKVAATVNTVVKSLLTKEPKKVVAKAVKKKSPEKKRMDEMAASAKLTKPVAKKAVPKVKVVVETPPQ
jgi:hypothetical protein